MVCLDTDWLGHRAAYRFKCREGHEWQQRAYKFPLALPCPTCAKAPGRKDKRLHADGLARLQNAARAQGGECLSGEYLGQAARYSFRCAAGRVWDTAGGEVLRGSWCRPCAHERRGSQLRQPDGLARLQKAAADRGGVCLSDAYAVQSETYQFRCRHGHKWSAPGTRILLGSWCPTCVNLQKSERMMRLDGLAQLQAMSAAKGGVCLSTKYLGTAHRYQFWCWCGKEWEAIGESVCQGAWCAVCAHVKRRLTLEAAREAAHARGGECLSTAYVSNTTKMSRLCDRGHPWQTTLAVIRMGRWCPTCANMTRITDRNSKARMRYQNAGS